MTTLLTLLLDPTGFSAVCCCRLDSTSMQKDALQTYSLGLLRRLQLQQQPLQHSPAAAAAVAVVPLQKAKRHQQQQLAFS
jgi:hypothetical protein